MEGKPCWCRVGVAWVISSVQASEKDVRFLPPSPGLNFATCPPRAGCRAHSPAWAQDRRGLLPRFPRGWVPPPQCPCPCLGAGCPPPQCPRPCPGAGCPQPAARARPGRGRDPHPARPASRLRPAPPPGARHFLPGPEKALPGSGDNGGGVQAMVALENPEGGPEEAAAAAGVAPGGRRTL